MSARVSLDRSDAKNTIKQIQLDVCNMHVEWEMTSSWASIRRRRAAGCAGSEQVSKFEFGKSLV